MNNKLLAEAIQAFLNNDLQLAKQKMRKHFVESASKINQKIEEEMEHDLQEDIDADPTQDFTDDVGYKLDETEEEDVPAEEFDHDVEKDEKEAGDDVEDEHDADLSGDAPEGVEEDQWNDIKDTLEQLTQMFDEIRNGNDDADVDLDIDADDGSESVEGNFEDSEGDDEFSDVDFSDEMTESFKMQNVAEPAKTEESGVNKKSVVAPNATSVVDGVKPVTIKDGSVDATDTKFENSDTIDAKVEDNNNVMPNGKNVMKPAKEPKHTAEKSKSPVPASAGKVRAKK